MKKTPFEASEPSGFSSQTSGDVLVRVENVSKKFCRDLKRSLWYGMKDLGSELFCRRHNDDVELRKDEFWALKDVSFELRRGECLGLIGRNGAGKTTLLRMLNGLIKPDKGRIEMHGRVGALIALCAGFNPILTGRENIYVNGSILGFSKAEIDVKFDAIIEFAEIGDFIDTPVQNYSSGMQVRLGFAVAAQMEPDVLILDEILAVGDASFQVKCLNAIRKLQKKGVGTILVSHNMINILRYCDIGLYLSKGVTKAVGPILDISSLYVQDEEPLKNYSHAGNVPTNSGIALHAIYVTDENNNIVEKVRPNQSIKIHTPYELEKNFSECELTLGLGIDDFEGVFFQSILPPVKFQGGSKGRIGELIVSIKSLCAASGTLTIGVALWSHPDKDLLAWSQGNKLLIQQISHNAGRVELIPELTIKYCSDFQ